MYKYICLDCGSLFDEPTHDDLTCPLCNSDSYEEADYCNNRSCGNQKPKTECLCAECAKYTKKAFFEHLAGYTAEELEFLDELTSGKSFEDAIKENFKNG